MPTLQGGADQTRKRRAVPAFDPQTHNSSPVELSMRSLSDTSVGRFAVLTLSSSIYTLDLNQRVFERDAASPDHDLRRDGDTGHLIAVISCEVGKPMRLAIDLNVPGVDYNTLTTTPVVLIETLSPVSDASEDHR